MKKSFFTLAFILIISLFCKGQSIYGNYGGLNLYNLETCQNIEREAIYRSNTLAIDENGLFFSTEPILNTDSFYIVLTDYLEEIDYCEKIGPFEKEPGNDFVAGCSAGGGIFYLGDNFTIFEVNFNNQNFRKLENFEGFVSGDYEFHDGLLYTISHNDLTLGNSIFTFDGLTGAAVDTFFQGFGSIDTSLLTGIAAGWSSDCSKKVMHIPTAISPNGQLLQPPYYHWITELPYDYTPGTIPARLCEGFVPRIGGGVFDAASWDTHRQTCEVRLDLDSNDSQGRAGPHFRDNPICTELFPIADQDLDIWTMDDRPLDSLHVRLHNPEAFGGGDLLSYLDMPGLRVISQADTLLRLFPEPGAESFYALWTNWLGQVRLATGFPQIEGRRTVETFLFAGGIRSDGARSYINVRPQLPYAGPDTTLYVCRNRWYDPADMLIAAGATPGGHFEPALVDAPFDNDGRLRFHADSLPYGTYAYITDLPNCTPDTAYVKIELHPTVANAFPTNNITVYLCQGETFTFHPGAIENVRFFRYGDRVRESLRVFTEPGVHQALVGYDNVLGCEDVITLTILPSDQERLTVAVDTSICQGDTLVYRGGAYYDEGTYSFNTPGNGCDTAFTIDLALREVETVEIDTSICFGKSLLIGDSTLSESGNYSIMVDDGSNCPIRFDVALEVASTNVRVYTDTSICQGDTLFVGEVSLTEPGDYKILAVGANCDTLNFVLLDVGGSLNEIDTALAQGNSLMVADTVLATPGSYTFAFTDRLGCDSIIRVELDIINGTASPYLPSGVAVQNPIRSPEAFRVFDAGSRLLPVKNLALFTAGGRLVYRKGDVSLDRLPAGVYFYAFSLQQENQLYRGKVVIMP